MSGTIVGLGPSRSGPISGHEAEHDLHMASLWGPSPLASLGYTLLLRL